MHRKLGARMAPFGGFDMPIQYEGIVAEHEATRRRAALFDTCHMGEFILEGPDVVPDLEHVLTCSVGDLAIGKCRYGLMCDENGGVLDDLVLYRLGKAKYLMVVNAGTQERDFEWVCTHVSNADRFRNISAHTGKVDLQGPASPMIMEELMADSIARMTFYSFVHNHYRDTQVLVSRTGYTGEVGFEVYGEPDLVLQFWCDAMELGAVPAGLGARDTLRLEMGMPLYGHELSEDRNAGATGFQRPIARDKDFIGSPAVLDEATDTERLVGIRLSGRRSARESNRILDESGNDIGVVTSGSFAPSVGAAVALAYVRKAVSSPGTPVRVDTGRRQLDGQIAELPFYRQGTARQPLARFLERRE
ncbi:MAG: glycine cleavage system aminomethyltransferase GcvT [Candidatus Pacebacteria bacterium]|nr:glycine cleavage system aminomethyltransferase GcvT [Candidatus Paceibacterota bacterium]